MGAFRQASSWISGKVNGTEHRILIDTGASVGVVTPEVAEMSTYKSDKEISWMVQSEDIGNLCWWNMNLMESLWKERLQ